MEGKRLDTITAYGHAKEGGYTGTYEEFCVYLAQVGNNSESAAANALVTEGYSLGTQNGQSVESGPYFEHNARYFAQLSEQSAQRTEEMLDSKLGEDDNMSATDIDNIINSVME